MSWIRQWFENQALNAVHSLHKVTENFGDSKFCVFLKEFFFSESTWSYQHVHALVSPLDLRAKTLLLKIHISYRTYI